MALGEFALIDRYFKRSGAPRRDVAVGIGDDGAVLEVPRGKQLVAVMDTLVEGIHFPSGSPPDSIGHRALAVNLSDLAAMGAVPAWALLALTLPIADEAWLAAFVRGFVALAEAEHVALVGGDTTSGPLSVTVSALGFVEAGCAITRSGARAGDSVWVSGTPGDAAFGLTVEQATALSAAEQTLRGRFRYPAARVALGQALVSVATACIDVSDGLLADARKLAEASGCAVEIDVDLVPLSAELIEAAGRGRAQTFAMTGGDDYELCFTLPSSGPAAVPGCHRIGVLKDGRGAYVHASGRALDLPDAGFDHFAAP